MKFSSGGEKNQNSKVSVTQEVTSLKEEEGKNPIIPELKTYGSVCDRTLFCLLSAIG